MHHKQLIDLKIYLSQTAKKIRFLKIKIISILKIKTL